MNKKSFLSGREKKLYELVEQYEAAKAENKTIYMDADDLADLADWYAVRRKNDLANEVADYGLKLHPGHTGLLVQKAYICCEDKKKAWEIVNYINEDLPEVTILKANLLLGEGKIDAAEQLLDTIEDKEDLANIIEVGYMYLDMGYLSKAWEWIERGMELHAEEEAFLAVIADYYQAQGENEKAECFYNKLIDKNPYSVYYWFGLARCYFDQQMYEKAIEACDYAIVSDDEFSDIYSIKGHSFFQLGNEEEALEAYRKAEELGALSPGFAQTFIGLNHLNRGEWEEGLKHLEMAIAAKPKSDTIILSSLHASAALCLYKLGQAKEAHQYCQKAHKLAPDMIDAYLIEGRIYMEEGKFQKGIDQWSIALDYAPDADTWYEIGLNCLEMGVINYARHAFECVKEIDPDYEDINEKLTIIYMMLKDKENFQKYNQLCEYPFQLEDLMAVQKSFEGVDQEELAKAMNTMSNLLK